MVCSRGDPKMAAAKAAAGVVLSRREHPRNQRRPRMVSAPNWQRGLADGMASVAESTDELLASARVLGPECFAHHEAAHATACWVCASRIRTAHIWIARTPTGWPGETRLEGGPHGWVDYSPMLLAFDAMITAAGRFGHEGYFGGTSPSGADAWSAKDDNRLRDAARWAVRDERLRQVASQGVSAAEYEDAWAALREARSRWLAMVATAAQQLVSEHWGAVGNLAQELLRHEVKEIPGGLVETSTGELRRRPGYYLAGEVIDDVLSRHRRRPIERYLGTCSRARNRRRRGMRSECESTK